MRVELYNNHWSSSERPKIRFILQCFSYDGVIWARSKTQYLHIHDSWIIRQLKHRDPLCLWETTIRRKCTGRRWFNDVISKSKKHFWGQIIQCVFIFPRVVGGCMTTKSSSSIDLLMSSVNISKYYDLKYEWLSKEVQ